MPIHTEAARKSLGILGAGIVNAASAALQQAINETTKHAKATTLFQDQTGTTRQSIHGERNGFAGHVEAGGAAFFLENGTPEHPIEAHGTALRFVINGTVFYRKRVKHKAMAPRPFMAQAREEGAQDLARFLDFFTSEAIRRA